MNTENYNRAKAAAVQIQGYLLSAMTERSGTKEEQYQAVEEAWYAIAGLQQEIQVLRDELKRYAPAKLGHQPKK